MRQLLAATNLLLLLLPPVAPVLLLLYAAASSAASADIRCWVQGPLSSPDRPWLLATGAKPQLRYSCWAVLFSAATCSSTFGSPHPWAAARW